MEVPPVQGYVIPWDAIVYFIFRMSRIVPLYAVSADQVGYHYLAEQLVPYGYKIARISDDSRSEIFHNFINDLMEGGISIAGHPKTLQEFLALSVDEKTGKVSKPAGGSKDCVDALVSLVALIKMVRLRLHDLKNWRAPNPPQLQRLTNGRYQLVGDSLSENSPRALRAVPDQPF